MGCTFEVGYFEDHDMYGVSQPEQRRAGFMGAVNDLGVLWYDSEWVKDEQTY